MTPLIITEDTARAALRVLTTALNRMPPPVPLCAHHDGTMRHWRDTHPHEDTEGYQRRCEDIARQCCQSREDQP